ncbi:hypothetical protein [uncultured Formosa sp.]|uniref:hypothetical protein n=1 Tax=uncultured Formosa sp. TaxID=255435 RepID=UPI0026188E62|nr:hypothetical protein [uncultured Formosa sp.]
MHCKKNLIKLCVFGILLFSNLVCAHNPDLSNIIISKTETGQIVIQINSSLTAFQQEVNYINGQGAYKSPEEFQDLVLNHFKNSFSIIINKKDTLQFKNPKVFLGHETKLVAEIIGLPETVNAIHLQNKLFKDIYNNQSVAIFLLDEFPKDKYTLDRDNNQEINIELVNGKWQKRIVKETNPNLKYGLYLTSILLAAVLLYFVKKKRKSTTL